MKNIKRISVFEIIILVVSIFAFAYIIGGTNREIIPLVSAQESLWTCLENQDGSICQEYPSSICNENCLEECFPGSREDFSLCNLGTCLDPIEGTCSPNSPSFECGDVGGDWFEISPGECNPGCCLIGDEQSESQYVTDIRCGIISQHTGLPVEWLTVTNEIECLALASQQNEGACVFVETEEERNCKFTTEIDCSALGGEFHKDLLCSHPELDTVCEKQINVNCFEGKDELYWFDSCGNKENIYDSNKVRSWNNGNVLSKSESCELSSGNNPFGNQKRCGNCIYFTGSICGIPGEGDENIVDSALGDYVCKDLSCVDEYGDVRINGESWCAFDSRIGLDNENIENDQRSVDVPGSKHYRKSCFGGEVRTEPCADFRGEICVENRDDNIDFSSAACRINQWQLCIQANTDQEKLDKCETHSDCSLKRTDIDEFAFDVCTPKYPPGFDLKVGEGDVENSICAAASQTCTTIEVKSLLHGWECKANCNCRTSGFTEAMNNLCMSLGDCGAHVNIVGEYQDDGYTVRRAPRLDIGYINDLKNYVSPLKGQKANPLSAKELAAFLGVQESTFENEAELGELLGRIGLGATGVVATIGILSGVVTESSIVGVQAALESGVTFSPQILGPELASFANVLAAAALGAAVGYFIGKAFDLEGEGLDIVVIAALVVAGLDVFITQILIQVYQLQGLGYNPTFFTTFGSALITAIIVAIILTLLEVGNTRERRVEFTCLPWQPPIGGADCEICTDGELPCSKYKCQSLGQNCEFINEGTSDELCVDINPNDVSSPIIGPNENAIGEDFVYTEIQNNGFRIEKQSADDGCIQEYSPVQFGISLDEPGQCKIEEIHTERYGDMENFFGENNFYKLDHGTIISTPTLESLGVPGVDPDRRGQYNLFVRCQDSSGNTNIQEYNLNFCISPGNDLTPPSITKFIPESPGFVGFEHIEKFVQFFTNEPADCRWDIQDEIYEEMENLILCENEINDVTLFGWMCSVILPVTEEAEQNYYFRCEDQPWLLQDDDEENDEDRNVNMESTIYTIKKSSSELLIGSIMPSDELISVGSVPVSIDLEIKTEGGVDGTALCEFNFDSSGGIYIDFFETGGNIHKQTFSTLFDGEFDMGLKCTDVAGNVALDNTQFEIEVDSQGPSITSVYNLNNKLYVITNEDSKCAFDFDSCSFNFEEGEEMSGEVLVHTTPFEHGLTYSTKCKDDFGNIGTCLRVRGGY